MHARTPNRDPRWKRRLGRVGLWLFVISAVLLGLLIWLTGPDAADFWIRRAEETLAEHGCPSHLGTLQSARLPATVVLGPVRLCEDSDGKALLSAESLRVKARFKPLLRGQLSAESLVLEAAELNVPHLIARLKSGIGRSSAAPHEVRAASARVEWDVLTVHGLTVQIKEGHDERFQELTLRRSADGGQVHVEREDGAQLNANWAQPTQGIWRADASGDLPNGWKWLKKARFIGRLQTRKDSTVSRGAAEASFAVEDAVLEAPGLSDAPIGPWTYRGEGDLSWDTTDSNARRWTALHWDLKGGPTQQSILQGSAEATAGSSLSPSGDDPGLKAAVAVAISDVPFGSWLEGLPSDLRPPASVPRLPAPLRGMLRWSGPLFDVDQSRLELALDLHLLREVSRDIPWALRGGFSHVPRVGTTAGTRTIWVGDTNPLYVPLTALPEYMVKAVLVSEDAGFYGHSGFEIEEVQHSLWDPRQRDRHRGASTLSQQLAKNLFLDGERTYARKVREAFSTVTLEAALPKPRILEIYFNLIEWGPEIYGIGEAAQHYFGVKASQLTPKQAAFLASIIPNPVRYHVYYEQGALSETWEGKVKNVLRKMRDAGSITPEAYAEALATPLTFHRDGSAAEPRAEPAADPPVDPEVEPATDPSPDER